MKPEIMNLIIILTIYTIMTLVLVFPNISFELWRLPMEKWEIYKTRILTRKSRRAEEKLRQFWEIDLMK